MIQLPLGSPFDVVMPENNRIQEWKGKNTFTRGRRNN